MNVVIIGPGLSLNQETAQLARELTIEIDKPVLVDADGITALSRDIDILKRRSPTVLTPHLGEMARITGLGIARIDADKTGVLAKTCSDLGSIIVLKGANSLIGYPDGRMLVNVSGNCGMATAGSGDVLTGIIAAMMGLGLDIESAAAKGVFIHGAAGDIAAADSGQDGMTAQDILEHLPRALQMDREGGFQDLYPGIDLV
jgi:NAD(P)H-hydrate epimerase